MTLKYFQGAIDGFTNNTDEFMVLVGYDAYFIQPLTSGSNFWVIEVQVGTKYVDAVGMQVMDNGLTQTYTQLALGNYYKKRLLIPPGATLVESTSNAGIGYYGEFIQGTLEEVAKLL